MEIIFYRPIYLWFLGLIPLLVVVHIYSLKYVERKAMLFANFKAIERITGGEIIPKNHLLLMMRCFILILFVLSAAGVTLLYGVPSHEYDLVIALDASSSMSAKDFNPNRLAAAKNAALELVENVPRGSKVGVVSFSSTAMMLANPSSDLDKAGKTIQSVDFQKIGGTAIGDALIASVNALINSKAPKAIVLVTDGQNNIGANMRDAIEYCKVNEVRVFAVGIGTSKEAETALPELLAGLDEKSLTTAALETNGKYYSASNQATLQTAFNEIASKTGERTEENGLSVPFMAIAFLLVFVDWSLSGSRYRIIP